MKLVFEEFGQENPQPLIILHGFFASSRNWRFVAESLAEHFHVYVLDQRNHGGSPHDSVMDYPSMADDLLAFLNQQPLNTAHLLGHSMGGKVAMWFALTQPDKLNKLVVADIAPVSYSHCFDATISALTALPLAEISNRKQADEFLSDKIPDPTYRQFLLQNLVLKHGVYSWRVDLAIFKATAPNIIAFPDATHTAPYRGDSLFLAGSESNFVKADDLTALFPNTTLSIIQQAGHWLHVQQPAIFIERVIDFLR